MTRAIPTTEAVFDARSFRDRDGRLFRWRGGLYRGLEEHVAPLFAGLFRDGVIDHLVARGLLVETTLTDHALERYPMVVRHRALPFVSYPTEWSGPMLRDAALVTLDLIEALAERGLTLKDAHPWNVLFDGPRPLHVDLTSITPIDPERTWSGHSSFLRGLFHPLLLMARGRDQWARWLMTTNRGAWRRDVITLAPAEAPAMLADYARVAWARPTLRRGKAAKPAEMAALLGRLRARLQRVGAAWTLDAAPEDTGTTAGERTVFTDLLTELAPRSMLSVDGRPAFHARAAAARGIPCVVFDTSEAAVAGLHLEARAEGLPILALVMDFVMPTPCHGLFGHGLHAAIDRLTCDLVVAPRLRRRLDDRDRRLTCEQLVDGLALFAKRWVVIGFEPPADQTNRAGLPDHPSYRSLEQFTNSIRPRFRSVRVITSEPSAAAILVCEK